jgi:hypothetical protein
VETKLSSRHLSARSTSPWLLAMTLISQAPTPLEPQGSRLLSPNRGVTLKPRSERNCLPRSGNSGAQAWDPIAHSFSFGALKAAAQFFRHVASVRPRTSAPTFVFKPVSSLQDFFDS